MTPEKKVKQGIKKVLDKLGAYYFMPATGGYGASGVPDIIVCYQGAFIGIEAKANGGKPTTLQLNNLNAIVDNGGKSLIIDEHNLPVLESLIKFGSSIGKSNFKQFIE